MVYGMSCHELRDIRSCLASGRGWMCILSTETNHGAVYSSINKAKVTLKKLSY
jgi:hypothetical protein